jgi:hypothetical protein
MSLHEEIDLARAEIRTDSYAISIGEWISLYEKEEIDIHPEFQRFFRWSPEQKSRLIESILLGIPVPQIFVSQREDGIWDVVDGLQRLSTIYQLVGILKDEDGRLVGPLELTKTEYLPSLEGRVWESAAEPEKRMAPAQRLLIKRAKLDVSIILRESEERTKYELFQRLNTGGTTLSDQEVRNAILVMLNRDLYFWIAELAQLPDFVESIALSDRSVDMRYDMELVLRFLSLRRAPEETLKRIGDVGDFLTQQMREMAADPAFRRGEEEQAFRDTFALLNQCAGSASFRRWDQGRQMSLGGFSVSAFEAVALGIGFNPQEAIQDCGRLCELINNVWADPEFTENAGSGIRASTRIPKIVPFGRERFRA